MVGWSSAKFTGAGWLVKNEKGWSITNEGIQALKDFPDAKILYDEARKLNRQWKKAKQGKLGSSEDTENKETETPTSEEDLNQLAAEEDGNATSFLEETQSRAYELISDYLANMPPYVFQKLVADLLRAMGYYILWDADTPGPDGGVDIIAYNDPLGMTEPRIKVQVKRQKNSISLPDLKSFIANIGAHDAGIFVCTGGFTGEAEKFARASESKQITTINQRQLLSLWTTHSHKLDDLAKQRFPLTPVYLLSPPE
jgi:restriction system protein